MDKEFLKRITDSRVEHTGAVKKGVSRAAEEIGTRPLAKQLDVALDILYYGKDGDPGCAFQDAGLCLVTKIIEGVQKSLETAPRSTSRARPRPATPAPGKQG